MMENVIELQNVTKSFKGFQVKDLSISVKKVLLQGLSVGMGQEIHNN